MNTTDGANARVRALEAEIARLSANLLHQEPDRRSRHAASERYRLALEAADIGTFDLDILTGELVGTIGAANSSG